MKVFIFPSVDQCSGSYHSGGGLVIIARDDIHAAELLSEFRHTKPTVEEWAEALVLNVEPNEHVEPQVLVFPDAGCC